MRFLVAEKLGPHKFKTPEGYLICTDAILSRTGKQEYKRCEIFGDSCDDPDKVVNVDRTDEEVFSDKAMASFENKPVCIEHPDVDVNAENHNELAVGFVRDVHKGEYKGSPVMMGTLVITDKDAVEAIENKEYEELSCGYDCDIEDDGNPCQRNIRGNHVALCKQGRAGIAHIVDSELTNDVPVGRQIATQNRKILMFRNTDKFNDLKNEVNKLQNKRLSSFERNTIENRVKRIVQELKEDYNADMSDVKNNKVDATEQAVKAHYRKANAYIIQSGLNISKICDEEGVKDMKDIQKTTTAGTDKIIYVMQSDIDENLYFYIGKTFSMKEGTWGYTKFEMGNTTPEQLKAELTKNWWHRVVKGPARMIDASNEEWTVVEEENYNKANKPIGAKDEVEKNFKIYVKNAFGAYKVVDWPAVSKEAAVKEFLEANPEYRKKGIIEARDAVNDSKNEQLFTVEYEQDGMMYVRKVRAASVEDAIAKARK